MFIRVSLKRIRFSPKGTVEFDNALLMTGIKHEGHSVGRMRDCGNLFKKIIATFTRLYLHPKTLSNSMNTHPYEPFIPEKATKLIIGSIPPQRFCNYADKAENALLEDDVDFYYGSRDNSFWQLLGEVFGVEFERANTQTAIEQRKSFLTKNGFGITDLVDICSRIEGF